MKAKDVIENSRASYVHLSPPMLANFNNYDIQGNVPPFQCLVPFRKIAEIAKYSLVSNPVSYIWHAENWTGFTSICRKVLLTQKLLSACSPTKAHTVK